MSDAKPRICILYTGGTIAMVKNPGGSLVPPGEPAEFFLRTFGRELDEVASYDFVELLNKDSTNVVPADWRKIARAIYNRRDMGYEGFVVVHGTDTMHFSASAVAFALGPILPFPVVFTGAQTYPEVLHGDARVNLLRACAVASEDIGEVVIAFGDYIFRGARAQKKDERRFDAFESPALFPLGFITEEIVLSPIAKKRDRSNTPIKIRDRFAKGVLQVSLIPGLEPHLLMPALEQDECKGLILQSFGAGNVPNAARFSFTKIIRQAVKREKPVIITSQFPANATLHTSYAPGQEAVKAGAIPTGNMTASCSVAKFRWVLARAEREGIGGGRERMDWLRDRMSESYIGELDPPSTDNNPVGGTE
jgi:L-asparaginase